MEIRYETREDAVSLYGIWEEHRVLDVGCGPGAPSQFRKCPSATHFQRADVITDMGPQLPAVHGERRRAVEMEGGIYPSFVSSNAEMLPFKDKSFDFIWCAHVLEHVEDPEKACGELMRVGKRGRIRTPSYIKEFFRPNPDHIWFVTWEANQLIFQRKPPFFFHYVHRNLVRHPKITEWYDSRAAVNGFPLKLHETIFDWFGSFEVTVYG